MIAFSYHRTPFRATKPDKGWSWMVLVASFSEHCIAGFCMYAVGLFHITILDKFHASVTLTSWLSSVFLCLLSMSGPLASYLIDKWSCRVTMILGSILLTVGLLITAFATSIIMVLISFGFIAGIGIGLMYNTGYIVLAFNFENKRNIATGIAVSGCGIGPFILSPVYQMIHHAYGYNGFFLLVGGLTLQACVLGSLIRPSHIEMTTKLARRNRKPQHRKCLSCDLTIFKNIPVLCIGLAGLLFNIGIFLIYLHFPKYAMENGASELQVSWYLSMAGICSCVSRVLLGMASNSDNISEEIMYFGSYVLLGGTTLSLPLLISFHSARIVYMIMLGLHSGTCYVVLNTIVLRLTGPTHVAQGTGLVMAFIGVGTLIGPPLGGVIVDNVGTYDTSFMVAGFSLIFGGCLELCNVVFKTEDYEKATTGDLEIDVENADKDVVPFESEKETF